MISLCAGDLELRFANKRVTSLPGEGETEYNCKRLQTALDKVVRTTEYVKNLYNQI